MNVPYFRFALGLYFCWDIIELLDGITNHLRTMRGDVEDFASECAAGKIRKNQYLRRIAGETMSSVTVQIELPEDWSQFSLPPALDARLTELLNEQDHTGCLNEAQRREAEALCNLVDMLALLKLRAESTARKSSE